MKSLEDICQRYVHIVSDYNNFLAALSNPLRTTFRISPIKAKREEILDLLRDISTSPLSFYEDGFMVNADHLALGNHLAHFLGYIYIQEASSMIPPLVLGPALVTVSSTSARHLVPKRLNLPGSCRIKV